jgi:hypothetical protein
LPMTSARAQRNPSNSRLKPAPGALAPESSIRSAVGSLAGSEAGSEEASSCSACDPRRTQSSIPSRPRIRRWDAEYTGASRNIQQWADYSSRFNWLLRMGIVAGLPTGAAATTQ